MVAVPLFFILVAGGLLLGLLIGLGLLIANRKTRTAGLVTLACLGCLAVVPFAGWLSFQSNVSQIRRELGEGVVVADPNSPRQNAPIDNPLSYVRTEYHVSWGVLLLPVTIIGALAAAAWRCFGRGRNAGGVIVSALAAVVLLAFGLRFWEMQRVNSQPRAASIAVASQPASTAAEAFDKLTKPRIQLEPPLGANPPAGADPPPGAEPPLATAAPPAKEGDGTEVVIHNELTGEKNKLAFAQPHADSRPNWVTTRPSQADGVYRRVLKSGPFQSDDACNEDQRMQVLNAALEYVRHNAGERYGRIPGYVRIKNAKALGTSYSELVRRIVKQEHEWKADHRLDAFQEQTARTLYTFVEINQGNGDWLVERWALYGNRRSADEENIMIVGFLACSVLGLVAGAYGLLRVDNATGQRYSKWLFIGGPVGILVTLGLLVVVIEILD